MQYYREYIEVTDEAGAPYVAEVRLCHDWLAMPKADQNQVVILDERVPVTAAWDAEDMPTETWAVMA